MAEPHCLYLWPMSLIEGAVGHISLNVWDPEKRGHYYISHWPKYACGLKSGDVDPTNPDSLHDDIILEENRKPEIVQIPFDFLNPTEIIKWHKNQKKPYNMKTWNCANVVCAALQIGLTDPVLELKLKKCFVSEVPEERKIPLFPKDLFSWVQRKVKEKNEEKVQEKLDLADSASVKLYPCAPLEPTDNFSGRSAHLTSVCEDLKSPDKKTALVVTAGIGGVGKTEFARKVAQESFHFFGGRIFWMDSETPESLQKCLLDLSTNLKIPHHFKLKKSFTMTKEEMKQLFKAIYSHFEAKKQNSLFIFDNVNQFKPSSSPSPSSWSWLWSFLKASESIFLISDFLPNSFPPATFRPCPAILITSRSSDWAQSKDFQMVNLQNFTFNETLEYFKNSFPETLAAELKKCEPEIKELHRRFDGYTLAFTLATGWIRNAGLSKKLKEGIKCYLQLFERPSNDLHKKDKTSSSLDSDYKFDPHEIMKQTCAVIEEENPLALKLLKQMSFLSPDFLTANDCVDLNKETPYKQITSALNTLSKFNLINVIDDDKNPSIPKLQLVSNFSDDNIKIHRVIQQLVKESQTKSRDVSILFKMCEKLDKGARLYNLPHLKSLIGNLQEFRVIWPVRLLTEKSNGDHYIKKLRLLIENLQLNDDLSLRVVYTKLQNFKPLIDAESVMDNSDFLDESNKLYKIKYRDLAEFCLLCLIRKYSPLDSSSYSIAIVSQLHSLGIWPQLSLDKVLRWPRRQTYESWMVDQLLLSSHRNPHTTAQQQQQLDHFKMMLDVRAGWCFTTDKNTQDWLNILQPNRTLDDQFFFLTGDSKIEIIRQGIDAAFTKSALDDNNKYSLFLNIIQENCKTVDGDGSNAIAKSLFRYMLHRFTRDHINSLTSMQKFTKIFLVLVPFSQPFSSDLLDNIITPSECQEYLAQVPSHRREFCCRFLATISILSGLNCEQVVSQIDSYFKRLREILEFVTFKDIKFDNGPEEREILKGFLPYLNSFVEQNQNSEDENAKELVKVVRSVILASEYST